MTETGEQTKKRGIRLMALRFRLKGLEGSKQSTGRETAMIIGKPWRRSKSPIGGQVKKLLKVFKNLSKLHNRPLRVYNLVSSWRKYDVRKFSFQDEGVQK